MLGWVVGSDVIREGTLAAGESAGLFGWGQTDLAEAGRPLTIAAPIIYPGAWKVAERIKDLKVTDADGEVPLAATDDPPQPGGFPYYRHWKAQRAVKEFADNDKLSSTDEAVGKIRAMRDSGCWQ